LNEDKEIFNLPLDKTILIIDDEESIRNSCKEILERDGIKVLTAKDGVEGINVLEKIKMKYR